MNLVGGYGSDSEDEEVSAPVKQPLPIVQAPAAVAPSRRVATAQPQLQQKKVKRLDISILPPEIQAALARGDSTKDSDDEDVNFPSKVVERKASSESGGDNKSKLLGILPAPKQKEEPTLTRPDQVKTQPQSNRSVGNETEPQSSGKSKFSFGFSNTEVTRTKAPKTTVEAEISKSANKKISAEESDDALSNLPWMQAAENDEDEDRPLPFAVSTAPRVSALTTTSSRPTAASKSTTIHHAPIEPAAQSASIAPQQSYADYMRQTEQAYVDPNAPVEYPPQKKRKDREIELQLMSGDLSGIEKSGVVQDITLEHKWNELAYTEQQQRELEVQRGFGIGMNKMLTQVSKAQNRKHQLSSLAMKAAETELAMLEKRGARNLTKSETQGKYGW